MADGDRMMRATWVASLLTLLSRVLGLVRDKALVLVFGAAEGVLDSFLLAFTVPNLFRRIFGEGALTAAFLPVFVDIDETEGRDAAGRFGSGVATLLCLLLTAVAGAGMLACLGAARLAEPGSGHRLTLQLTAFLLPFLVLICLSALESAMLQGLRRFALPAAMPVGLNAAIVAALGYVLVYARHRPAEETVYLVAGAVLAGGVAQVVLQLGALWWRGVWLRPRLEPSSPGTRRVWSAMAPTVLGLAVFQVNVLVDRLIAYLLVPGEGALTHLYLGNRLMQLPLGLFGVAMATVAFPDLVSHFRGGQWRSLFGKLDRGTRFLLFVMLPSTAGLIALSEPLVRMIFQEPDLTFSDREVYRTSLVLVCYAPGLFFVAWQQLLARVHYARGDYRTPVIASTAMVGLNVILNLVLIHAPDLYARWHDRADLPLGEGGLALSSSICAGVAAWWLWRSARGALRIGDAAKIWDRTFAELPASVGRILVAAAGTGVFAYWVAGSIPAEPELLVRVERGLVSAALGALAYFVLCSVIPVPELGFLTGRSDKATDDAPPADPDASA
ncbi:MAG: murein biosynthesis integral membrane protein MurJ [Planctomycetota bacterium]